MFRRAKFIWTPQQAIDRDVSFRSLLVRGAVRREDGTNRWYLFRRRFELPAAAAQASLQIFADSRYQLYLNGERIGRGPSRATPAFARVDHYDVANRLRAGGNVLAVLVHVYGVDTAWSETTRDYTQSVFGDGGLYVDASIDCGGVQVDVLSDCSWRVIAARAWRSDAPRSGWGQGFIEDHDARDMPQDWLSERFDDSGWDAAQLQLRAASDEDIAKGWGNIEPFPTLLPRDIPPLVERPLFPLRILRVAAVPRDSELPLDQRIFNETMSAAPANALAQAEACLRDDEDATTVTTGPQHDISMLIAFDRRHAGYPFIEVEAQGGEIIELAAAETVPGEYTAPSFEQARVSRETYLDCAQLFRYTAGAGLQRFEKFDWTGLKYLQLVVRNAPRGLRIRRVGSVETHYPAEHQGAFECSDPFLNRLWQVGRYTALQCTHDAWEDCPGREKRQWLGDGIVHYLIDAAAFGSSTQPIDRRFLLQAAESQRGDGLLQMFAPGDHHQGGIIIPDFNLHWICALQHYLLHSGDLATAEQLLPAVQRSLDWFFRQTGPNDLLANVPHWHFIEWARVGREGESMPINALLVGALQAAAQVAECVGYAPLATRYRERAQRVRSALRARHFDGGRGVFVDSVDPQSAAQRPQVSQQGNALAILFDIAQPQEVGRIVSYIMDERRLRRTATPPVTFAADPLDPQTDVVRANTYFSHFLYSALGKAGHFDLALRDMHRLYGAMIASGSETLWESTEPVASLCHAFSATPVYQLPACVLGVTPTAPGFTRARVAPQWCELSSAAGCYPTPRGPIQVRWQRAGTNAFELSITVPDGIAIDLELPAGYGAEPLAARGAGEQRLLAVRR